MQPRILAFIKWAKHKVPENGSQVVYIVQRDIPFPEHPRPSPLRGGPESRMYWEVRDPLIRKIDKDCSYWFYLIWTQVPIDLVHETLAKLHDLPHEMHKNIFNNSPLVLFISTNLWVFPYTWTKWIEALPHYHSFLLDQSHFHRQHLQVYKVIRHFSKSVETH